MITPEQIKKLIDVAKPEGFIVIDRSIINTELLFLEMPCGKDIGFDRLINNELFELVYYPLFLQKCSEGINYQSCYCNKHPYMITIEGDMVRVINGEKTVGMFFFHICGSVDQAKEQALIYILDNIQKQD